MIIHHLALENSILSKFITEIRDSTIQKDTMRFRKNIERIGEVLSYELSKTLHFEATEVQTPLGIKLTSKCIDNIVLCSIMRAGLPLHQGILNYFDDAENAFISAYRHHLDGKDDFDVIVKYLAAPSIEKKTLILADPMLATGKTLENVLRALESHGTPEQIHIVAVIGSEEGVKFIENVFPENTHLWIADIDSELNSKGYIIPGLGDSGDLSYGEKM